MSRLGKTPIPIPKGVVVTAAKDGALSIKGPKGHLEMKLPVGLQVKIEAEMIIVECDEKAISQKSFYGLYRSLIRNNVQGVFEGFEVKLNLIGVGYKANVQGQKLDLQLGFSHPTWVDIPANIQVAVEKGTTITIKGVNKQDVGQFAAAVRGKKPPEPYKGKGIRYENEYVRKKEGKAAKGKA